MEKETSGWSNKGYGRNWATESDVGGIIDGLPTGMDGRLWTDGWEDGIPRVATGVKNRVDRLKCLGNAVVPQVVALIAEQIKPLLEGVE